MNGPTKAKCTQLIRLCGSLDYFPSDTAIRELLVSTLQRRAVSDEHAERIVNKWLETETVAPKVSDIVATAASVNPTPVTAMATRNDGCGTCNGSGWEIVYRGEHSGARPCTACGAQKASQSTTD